MRYVCARPQYWRVRELGCSDAVWLPACLFGTVLIHPTYTLSRSLSGVSASTAEARDAPLGVNV